MAKKLITAAVLVSVTLTVLGCATIVSKSAYPVTISSDPSSADIRVTNRSGQEVFAGTTPATVTLKAGAGYFKGEVYTVSFSKEGHVRTAAQIERKVDGWYIGGNIVLGGLIGWLIVDPATGAMWKLEDLHVNLDADADAAGSSAKLNILSIEDLPAEARPSLVPIN